jgi:hypothetical protein
VPSKRLAPHNFRGNHREAAARIVRVIACKVTK